jgi:hypothetical protein
MIFPVVAPLMVKLAWFFRTWVLHIRMLEITRRETRVVRNFSGACLLRIGELGYAFILK